MADLIRGNQNSQEFLAKTVVTVPHPSYRFSDSSDPSHFKVQSSESNSRSSQDQIPTLPPRPAVMALIAVAVGAEHLESYPTRAAATYAFEVNHLHMFLRIWYSYYSQINKHLI